MMEFTQWCSLFCTGTEAEGDLTIEFEAGAISVPICAGCLEVVQKDPAKALALAPSEVLEFDPEEGVLDLLPATKE